MPINKELELAWDFVNHTDRHIFLTGKAGTGKTTFLHHLKKESLKRLMVVAPTGVAAINAKGVTIHSLFQLPFGPIIPNQSIHNNSSFKYRFSKKKIDLIKSTDLLVIDEISMVRCDVLDGIDNVLRRYRDRNRPFGGMQVLMIGDLQQLSPVIRDSEWQMLKPYYKNGYFFSSHIFQECNAITIELEYIYRQENPKFIKILNEIRSDRLSEESMMELNQRYEPDFVATEHDGFISLTTHNQKAEKNNQSELNRLQSKVVTYKAKIKDTFPESSYPNDFELKLKVGAQVMFIKNDSSPEKRYYNGKIGKVIWLSKDEVSVECPDDEHPIIVTPETWENIKYDIDKDSKEVTEQLVGSYGQMPLRLAWSITIHKSQGLTFERAVIDAESAFAHGQTYVALSRCKSLEGLVLKSKISTDQVISDQQVSKFNDSRDQDGVSESELLRSKLEFQRNLISEVFDYFPVISPLKRVLDVFYTNRTVVFGKIEEPSLEIQTEVTGLLKVASAFKAQIKDLTKSELPESNEQVQERFKKAVNYFMKKHAVILELFGDISFTTDNSAVEKDIQKNLDIIETFLRMKSNYFSNLKERFSVQKFLNLRAKAQLEEKDKVKSKPNTRVNLDHLEHPKLFELLRELRGHIANSENIIHYQVFTQKTLFELCEKLPTSNAQLLKIKGMGKVRVQKFGAEILEVIREYCEDHEIHYNEDEPINFQPKTKVDTKAQSLKLFRSGLSVDEIAEQRGLNTNTIFGHLSYYITNGKIDALDLISKEHFEELSAIIPTKSFDSLSDLKHQLDNKFSYGEIKLVLQELDSSK